MNKQRRAEIDKLIKLVEDFKATITVAIAGIDFEGMKEDASDLAADEQEYFDNMPEGLQRGEKGQVAEETIGYLTDARDKLESIAESFDNLEGDIDEVIEALENAKGE
jgi:hypothetical protein